jgi:hypothetical protein
MPSEGERYCVGQVARSELRLDRTALCDHGVVRLDKPLRRLLGREPIRSRLQHFELRLRKLLTFKSSRQQHLRGRPLLEPEARVHKHL